MIKVRSKNSLQGVTKTLDVGGSWQLLTSHRRDSAYYIHNSFSATLVTVTVTVNKQPAHDDTCLSSGHGGLASCDLWLADSW